MVGTLNAPKGVLLHGTRSGLNYTIRQEFDHTVRYVAGGSGGWGWHATGGENIIDIHMEAHEFGWHAGNASREYLGYEFAQSKAGGVITDPQVETFCWYFLMVGRRRWTNLPAVFPMHSEVEQGIASGKTDVFARGSVAGDQLKRRIAARLRELGVS